MVLFQENGVRFEIIVVLTSVRTVVPVMGQH